MKRIGFLSVFTVLILLLLCACDGAPSSSPGTPAGSSPTGSPVEKLCYQNISFSAHAEWASPVVETDTHFYYIAADGIYEYTKATGTTNMLLSETAYSLYLHGKDLYYRTEHEIKLVDLQTKSAAVIWDSTMLPAGEDTDTLPYISIYDFALQDGYLYIAGTGTSVIRICLADHTAELFLIDCSQMVLRANDCYYLDHAGRTFSLYHMTCDSQRTTLLRGEGISDPEKSRIDGIAGIDDTIAYSVRDDADIYLYRPNGEDEKIFDGNAETVWLTLINQWAGKELYFYTTDGAQLSLYEYQSETGVKLLTSFACTARICDIKVTESAVFWWSEEEAKVNCFVKE